MKNSPDDPLLLLLDDPDEVELGPEPPAADDSAAKPTEGGVCLKTVYTFFF